MKTDVKLFFSYMNSLDILKIFSKWNKPSFSFFLPFLNLWKNDNKKNRYVNIDDKSSQFIAKFQFLPYRYETQNKIFHSASPCIPMQFYWLFNILSFFSFMGSSGVLGEGSVSSFLEVKARQIGCK